MSRSASGQTILFGCSLRLRTIGELEKIPPVLEYLLDSVREWPAPLYPYTVSQQHTGCTATSPRCKSGGRWQLVDEIEQAWVGVEESDHVFISKLDQANLRTLILVCLLRYTTI